MAQVSGNDAPPSPTNAGSSSPNSCAEIAELLSRLQFTNSQLQELFVALTDIATTKPTRQSPDETFDVINADDVSQDVSSEGSSDKDTHGTSCSPTTTAPSAIAAEPDAPSTVTTVPVTPTGAAVVAAPDAPSTVITGPPTPASAAVVAAPAAAATTRVFNGVSYQYPANGASGPFYLVTRGRDIGVFVGWENTSPLVTRVSASVSFRVPSAEEGRVRMESSIAAGFARRL